MGGFGSGRHHQSGKQTTSALRSLDIRWLQRKGLLELGAVSTLRWSMNGSEVTSIRVRTEEDHLIFTFDSQATNDERISESHHVYLDWSKCHLGGERVWFRCPMAGCDRRVALIYCGAHFACRHCHQLAYASQREVGYVRAERKADRLRNKLGWGPGIISCDRSKPKGMHWRTFARLAAEHDSLVSKYLAGMTQRIEKIERISG